MEGLEVLGINTVDENAVIKKPTDGMFPLPFVSHPAIPLPHCCAQSAVW